jgi:hypothetical protein
VAEERGQETLSAGGGGAEVTRLQLGIPKTRGKTSMYKGRWNKRRTVHLDPRNCRVPSSCLSENRAHATLGRSLEGRAG